MGEEQTCFQALSLGWDPDFTYLSHETNDFFPYGMNFLFLCFSHCMRKLVNLLVPEGVPKEEICPLEELWSFFDDTLIFLSHTVSQAMILHFRLILRI